jgi:hypothetical protein
MPIDLSVAGKPLPATTHGWTEERGDVAIFNAAATVAA